MTNFVSRWTAPDESHYATAASCEPIHQPRPLSAHHRHLPTSSPAVLPSPHTHGPPCHHNLLLSPSEPLKQSSTYQLQSPTKHRCRPSPRHRITAPFPTYSPETPSYQQLLLTIPQRPLLHLNCRPNPLHVLAALHGHPNGTNPKQDNGSLESYKRRDTLYPSQFSKWGG